MLHIASTYVLSAMKINWVVYKNQNRLTSRKFLHEIVFLYLITRYFFIKRIRLSLMPIYKISQSVTGMLNAHLYSILRFDTRNPPIVMLSGLRPTIFILSDNTKMTSIQTKFILKENVHQYVSTLNFSEFNRIETVMQSTNWQFYLSHKFVKEINLWRRRKNKNR